MDINKVFVGSLPDDLTDKKFKAMFRRFGKISEALIMTDKYSHKTKNFGYITFLDRKDAEKAIKEMDQKEVNGKKMLVIFAKKGS